MTLMTARALLITDRMDWNRPHLNWMTEWVYRNFKSRARKA